jgi:hypothetical protein
VTRKAKLFLVRSLIAFGLLPFAGGVPPRQVRIRFRLEHDIEQRSMSIAVRSSTVFIWISMLAHH